MKLSGLFLFVLMAAPLWAQDNAPTLAPTPEATAASISASTPAAEMAMPTPLAAASATPAMPKPPSLNANSAPMSSDNTPGGEHFVAQFDAGWVPAISSAAATQLGAGLDLEGRLSYAFDDFFSLGVESGFYNLSFNSSALSTFGLPSGATASLNHIPLLAVMQIGMGDEGGPIQPYLILGAGLAFDSYSVQGATFPPAGGTSSWVNFELEPGLGVAFALNKSMNFFVQGKLAMDFDNNNAGKAGEMADTPIIFTPIQAGLNFNL